MLYHLNGTVTDIEQNLAVIECGGVGYAVFTSANTISRLHLRENAKLYISEQIREDAFDLYGFFTMGEKRCFEMLVSVSGVGPKAAISILSANTPEGVCMAVMSGDERALTVAQGIGKKIAQRVILELKDKLQKQMGELSDLGGAYIAPAPGGQPTKLSDAAAALAVLGYSTSECAAALKGIDMEQSLENIIRAALRNMVK